MPRQQQPKQKVQQTKNKPQYDSESMIDDIVDEDIRSSEINETLKKTQTKNKNISTKKVDNKKFIIEEESTEPDEDNDKDSSDISDIDDDQEISDAFNYDDKKAKAKQMLKKSSNKMDSEDVDCDTENNIDDTNDDNDTDNNESNIDKDLSNVNDDELDEEYVQTVVMERVIKYIKLDDVIKEKQTEHRKEMKTLKDTKDNLEQFLIGFLDRINEEYIQLGNKSTLIKTETQTKAAPKMEDIGVCLIDGFRKYEIYEDDDEIKRVVKDFLKSIEEKREIKTRKYLKRTTGDPDKKGKGNAKNKDDESASVSNNTDTKTKGRQKQVSVSPKKTVPKAKPKARNSNK